MGASPDLSHGLLMPLSQPPRLALSLSTCEGLFILVLRACSHGRAAICAWDLRVLAYPVHEERLDHCIDVPELRLPRAARRSHGQGMFLSSHSDFVIGQAGNGAFATRVRARSGADDWSHVFKRGEWLARAHSHPQVSRWR